MSFVTELRSHYFIRTFIGGLNKMLDDSATKGYFIVLVIIFSLGIIGPWLAPYPIQEVQYDEQGSVERLSEPSLDHPLGTTDRGYDVLSRILVGARATVLAGLLGGSLIIGIGLTIGVTAGYVGGQVEEVLMRFTDFAYSVPLIPFAIVIIAFFGVGFIESVVVIGLLLWRGSARVLRSQVLQIRERPYILAARATGASTPRIIFKYILPNTAPMAVFFFAMGIGYTILIQAGLAFIGVSDPFVPSWGVMVRNAYSSGYLDVAWWWSLPAGFLISLTVLSSFMFGRGIETVSNQLNDESLAEAG
jgi:peptide/nickel transport system permease protein